MLNCCRSLGVSRARGYERLQRRPLLKLPSEQLFQAALIEYNDCRSFHFQESPFLEVGEQARHRFAGSTNHLGDYFVSQCQLGPNLSFSIAVVVAPVEKKPGKFFSG